MKTLKSCGLFPYTVFLGAFLLFQIQPIIGKYFLPWFGGAPAVWLTCLMFFQLLLLGGYTYAHVLQRLRPGRQAALHIGLLMAALATGGALVRIWGSPIFPDPSWRPSGVERPTVDILRLLLVSIGLAYFLLSTSASLLQAWFHRIQPERSPYIFYVVSNTASLLALLSYPLVIEPHWTIREQAWMWSGGFLIYSVLCGVCASRVRKLPHSRTLSLHHSRTPALPYSNSLRLLWTLLSFCGVLALMAITNQMTQDIPPVPFLCILSLSIYLLSYMIGFMGKKRTRQDFSIALLICAFGAVGYLSRQGVSADIRLQIAAYSFILFAICLFCHQALYRTKPDPEQLTGFYLCISLGGALGGLFTVLAAPFLFKGFWEYQLVLILSGALAVFFIYTDPDTGRIFQRIRHAFPVLLAGFTVFLVLNLMKDMHGTVYRERNFFGCVQVEIEYFKGIPICRLMHGRILHGSQIQHPDFLNQTTDYYTEKGGGGLAILNHPKRLTGRPMRVGLLGLGVGVLSAYARPGDVFRFYEIDPAIIRLAQNSPWFSFLRNSKAKIEIVLGDGRISLERELENGQPPATPFDVLVLDAYSGDQIPVQTLTLEAFEIYLRHLSADGILAVHITNRNLDLLPVLVQVRKHNGLQMAYIESEDADWVLLGRNPDFMRQPAIAQADSLKSRTIRSIRPWTDDYSNLLDVIK